MQELSNTISVLLEHILWVKYSYIGYIPPLLPKLNLTFFSLHCLPNLSNPPILSRWSLSRLSKYYYYKLPPPQGVVVVILTMTWMPALRDMTTLVYRPTTWRACMTVRIPPCAKKIACSCLLQVVIFMATLHDVVPTLMAALGPWERASLFFTSLVTGDSSVGLGLGVIIIIILQASVV